MSMVEVIFCTSYEALSYASSHKYDERKVTKVITFW